MWLATKSAAPAATMTPNPDMADMRWNPSGPAGPISGRFSRVLE